MSYGSEVVAESSISHSCLSVASKSSRLHCASYACESAKMEKPCLEEPEVSLTLLRPLQQPDRHRASRNSARSRRAKMWWFLISRLVECGDLRYGGQTRIVVLGMCQRHHLRTKHVTSESFYRVHQVSDVSIVLQRVF